MTANTVLVIGSSNTDMVVKTDRFPQPGETLLGSQFFMFPGGKGANQAVAAARYGGRVTFVAKVGNDIFGRQALEGFRREGIDTDYVAVDEDHASGTALILVNAQGENQITVASGANGTLSPADVQRAAQALLKAHVVLLQLETPLATVVFAAQQAAKAGIKVVLNPAPAQVLPDDLYPHLFLITPNETEAQHLTGIPVTDEASARQAAMVLLSRGVANVIITLGAKGAFVHNATLSMRVSAPAVNVVDTTAAGDVFNGVLAVSIAEGRSVEDGARAACRAAALAVTRMGAQSSAPYRRELTG